MSVVWGILALCQCAAKSFGSLLAIRIILGIFEAGFFAGATFYLTLFYTRGEMGFRLAIVQSFAVLASAFSGLISFGVFQIESTSVKGWQYLFIIEGGMTLLIGVLGFLILPDNAQSAWFLNSRERDAATARLLRDSSSEVATDFNLKACFQSWADWQFPIWCVIAFTYPVAYATAMNFFPLVSSRLYIFFEASALTEADRATSRILRCQDQLVDGCPKSCRRGGAAQRRQIIGLFSRENLSHSILPSPFPCGDGDSSCH